MSLLLTIENKKYYVFKNNENEVVRTDTLYLQSKRLFSTLYKKIIYALGRNNVNWKKGPAKVFTFSESTIVINNLYVHLGLKIEE